MSHISGLELKVPPDVVAVVFAAQMWVVSAVAPSLAIPVLFRIGISAVLVAVGVSLIVTARVALGRENTTWMPAKPGRTSHLVATGVYHFTRNPMYLGTLLILLGWAVALESPFSLIFPAIFMFYMNRFQIGPEERKLSALFGRDFSDYMRHVRRWL
ncbi:MAG: methyltransferase family protein [Thermoleophilia bacterium]